MFAVVRQMPVDHVQANQPDRNIHEENESPVKVSDDQAAGQRSQHRRNQGGMDTKLMARTKSDLANVRTKVRRPTGTIMDPPQP